MDNRSNSTRNACGIDVDVNGVSRAQSFKTQKLPAEATAARTRYASGYARVKTMISFGKPVLSTKAACPC
ncbi:hypothetical protein BTO02_00665 [Paraburkholderia sp. SOS3]|nr:hypothetical protein BTO02_00665 [Paraburkholderia sp. SOS3]